MRNGLFFRCFAVLCAALMLPWSGGIALAQSQKDAGIEGRLYDFDRDSALEDVTVRGVHTGTGQAFEDNTDRNGCYDLEKLPEGTYAISAYYKGSDGELKEKLPKDSLLPDKITVTKDLEKDKVVKTCLSLGEKDSLLLLEEKDCNLCRTIPAWVWLVPAGTVLGAGIPIIGKDEPEETSPSRP